MTAMNLASPAHFWPAVPTFIIGPITSAWWALEGLALLAFGHILPIDSALAIRNYARSNIPALLVGVVLVVVGLFGHLIPPDHASEAIPQ